MLIVAIIVLLVGGFFAYRYFSSYESTDDAQVDGHLMPLSARLSGYVIKVNVDDNQYVPQGTVLAEIDPRDYQVAVDKARGRSRGRRSHRAVADHQRADHFRQHNEPGLFVAGGCRKRGSGGRPRRSSNTTPPRRSSRRPRPTT